MLGDQTPRSQWKLAQITAVIRGKDKMIRAATVRTSNGVILQRAIQHLYPLEIHDENENEIVQGLKNDGPVPRIRRNAALEADKKISKISD